MSKKIDGTIRPEKPINYVTLKEASAITGVSLNVIRRFIREGLPHITLGTGYRPPICVHEKTIPVIEKMAKRA